MSQLTLSKYQLHARQFAKYNNQSAYPFAALSEESGEVMGKIAKYMRKNNKSFEETIEAAAYEDAELRDALKKELGDVLWQLQECCTVLNVGLGEIAELNLEKLGGRAFRGTIVGEGDER